MLFELPYRRMLVLTEGELGVFSSKTAVAVLRYRRSDCLGVLDSVHAGKPIESAVSGLSDVPIFASVEEAMHLEPDAVLIGIAPSGGALPERMRAHLVDALRRGLSVVSGLHALLRHDSELVELAAQHNARLHDIRDAGPITRIAQGLARRTRCKRVLTVGTDCNIGKKVTALELRRAAVEAGLDAAFVATGQTGIMIEGWGIAIDHIISDFAAGAAEMLVEHVADRQICFIEGQGSLGHPGYSGVTLSLLHGSCPDAMVIMHRPGRVLHNGWENCPIAPLPQQIDLYERVAGLMHPSKVVAVALNTADMSATEAAQAVAAAASETGLPAADPIRDGAGRLLAAVRAAVGV
jgi:uncharacterized NAD-dependent epimerase/dehydratase family protein